MTGYYRPKSPAFTIFNWRVDSQFAEYLGKSLCYVTLVESPWGEAHVFALFEDGEHWKLNSYSVRGKNKYLFIGQNDIESPEEKADQPRTKKQKMVAVLNLAMTLIIRILEKAWEIVLQRAFSEVDLAKVDDGTNRFRVFDSVEDFTRFASVVGSARSVESSVGDRGLDKVH